jgi:hypothetical protein
LTGRVYTPSALTREFTSAEQSITAAGALTIAHGLGARPKLCRLFIRCATAEGGYAIGDEVEVDINAPNSGANQGQAVWLDATNANVRFSTAASTLVIAHKTTGGMTAITNANWRLLVRCWA